VEGDALDLLFFDDTQEIIALEFGTRLVQDRG
jgi:ubiquinone/menaquinone biosynthesis C-methylase UbiE